MIKKKVLVVTSEFPPEPGGIGNHAYNLSKYLSKNNFEVTVIADQRLENSSKEVLFDNKESFSIRRIPKKKIRTFMYINRILTVYRAFLKNDTIIASGKFSLWIVAFFSIIFNKKTIAIIHGTEVNFSKRILRKSIDYSLKRFDEIVAVSNYTKSLVSYLKLNKITVIPNGYEVKEYSDEGCTKKIKGTPSIITVGNVTERKGQKNVINLLPDLKKKFPQFHYHIVGKPTEKKELLLLIKELGLEDYITFYGVVTEEKKNSLLNSSDIFVMLSENTNSGDVEGFGIALLEANNFGTPTIGAKNCGIEDAINPAKSGILINNKSSIEFNKAISDIMDKYDYYSSESKQWASKFTWSIIIKKYIKVIGK